MQVPRIEEKIVTIEKIVQQIKQVNVSHDVIVEKDKLIQTTDIKNQIETKINTVDRYEEKLVPVHTSTEKIVQVPHVL